MNKQEKIRDLQQELKEIRQYIGEGNELTTGIQHMYDMAEAKLQKLQE